MKVFKYLVALADISVGFLGIFFVIFAVTRPAAPEILRQKKALEQKIGELQAQLQRLHGIELGKTRAGRELAGNNAAEIVLSRSGFRVKIGEREKRFTQWPAFRRFVTQQKWPSHVILFVDRSLPFERVTQVIDALQQAGAGVQVQIAALAPGNK